MNNTHYETQQGVAVIRLDNAPVNGLSHAVRQGIGAAIRQAETDSAVTAIIPVGSQNLFSGGADMREFVTPAVSAAPNLLSVIHTMETATKSVIAAISVAFMGGGMGAAGVCEVV